MPFLEKILAYSATILIAFLTPLVLLHVLKDRRTSIASLVIFLLVYCAMTTLFIVIEFYSNSQSEDSDFFTAIVFSYDAMVFLLIGNLIVLTMRVRAPVYRAVIVRGFLFDATLMAQAVCSTLMQLLPERYYTRCEFAYFISKIICIFVAAVMILFLPTLPRPRTAMEAVQLKEQFPTYQQFVQSDTVSTLLWRCVAFLDIMEQRVVDTATPNLLPLLRDMLGPMVDSCLCMERRFHTSLFGFPIRVRLPHSKKKIEKNISDTFPLLWRFYSTQQVNPEDLDTMFDEARDLVPKLLDKTVRYYYFPVFNRRIFKALFTKRGSAAKGSACACGIKESTDLLCDGLTPVWFNVTQRFFQLPSFGFGVVRLLARDTEKTLHSFQNMRKVLSQYGIDVGFFEGLDEERWGIFSLQLISAIPSIPYLVQKQLYMLASRISANAKGPRLLSLDEHKEDRTHMWFIENYTRNGGMKTDQTSDTQASSCVGCRMAPPALCGARDSGDESSDSTTEASPKMDALRATHYQDYIPVSGPRWSVMQNFRKMSCLESAIEESFKLGFDITAPSIELDHENPVIAFLDEKFDTWTFNTFTLASKLPNDHPLLCVLLYIHSQKPGLFQTILRPFSCKNFAAFALAAEAHHRLSPFFTPLRAADCVHLLDALLGRIRGLGGWQSGNWLSEEHHAALLIAAAMRGLDNINLPNSFLYALNHPLVNIYGKESPTEKHVTSLGMHLLGVSGFEMLHAERAYVQHLVIATDPSLRARLLHRAGSFNILLRRNKLVKEKLTRVIEKLDLFAAESALSDSDTENEKLATGVRLIFHQLLFILADNSFAYRTASAYRSWAERYTELNFLRGDLAKRFGGKPRFSENRDNSSKKFFAMSQLRFFQNKFVPLQASVFTLADTLLNFESIPELDAAYRENMKLWHTFEDA